ncbi:hypothetical protein QBC35DRAFT_265539 [Podospora australis]|uniref:NADH dehydrogenase [ubiquinone] 1 alpha subcomplex assembly factor 3 n=1 Tax=Podospora australis TaxID=1536484 RepID=A0AAN6WSL1_9PEZI|nr:hypothetical protein QBC35DRAFT_265539 [Podospora australis]
MAGIRPPLSLLKRRILTTSSPLFAQRLPALFSSTTALALRSSRKNAPALFSTSQYHNKSSGSSGSGNPERAPDQPPPTDFSQLDVLANTPIPSTAIDVSHRDGFMLNSGIDISGGKGALLVNGEAFAWTPWSPDTKRMINQKGQWEVPAEAFGLFEMIWPRPDLLILGLGPEIRPLSPKTRKVISALGMRVDVLDTRNAVNQYNMLATERGMDDVAAALIPIGWQEGKGC